MRHAFVVCLAVVGCQCGPSAADVDAGTVTPMDSGVDAGAADAGLATRTVLFAVQTDRSTPITDSLGERAAALLPLMNALPAETRFGVFAFGAATVTPLMPVKPLSELNSSARTQLRDAVLSFSRPTGALDLVAVLEGIRQVVAADTTPTASYDVVLVVNGVSATQQTELMCGQTIPAIAAATSSTVRLSTVLLNTVVTAACTETIDVRPCSINPVLLTCGRAINEASSARLRAMVRLGGGRGTHSEFLQSGSVVYALP